MTLTEKAEMIFSEPKLDISLKETLKKRAKQQLEEKGIDWKERKDIWLKCVKALYDEFEHWFPDYIEEGFMAFDKSKKKTISEKDIETYDIDILEINIEGDIVVFDPIGTNIVGAFGRVDVYLRGHKADKVMLLLSYSDKNHEQHTHWKLLFETYQFDFNKARFEELLLLWFKKWSDEFLPR